MGYCITQRESQFRIKKENFDAALAAIKVLAMDTAQMSSGSSRAGRWFDWVETKEFVGATTLKEAIKAWRWETDVNDAGDIVDITFDGEKLGDDILFFEAIAPFVERGSYIKMTGEDGCLWRWVFDGKRMEEKTAKIAWD